MNRRAFLSRSAVLVTATVLAPVAVSREPRWRFVQGDFVIVSNEYARTELKMVQHAELDYVQLSDGRAVAPHNCRPIAPSWWNDPQYWVDA